MLSAIQIPERDPLVGALLDERYHVTGVLGRGGMGIVYEGLQQPLGRSVAIKVLGHNIARDPIVVARFLREARFASGLAHGNIVDVSDLGRLPDGRPYLVMPKVAGIDFATLMEREGPMAPARVANLLRGVAAALDLVHAKGLVHRDVKPENLMHVLRADGSETVMLLDFGLAALLPGNAARLTGDDMMCGSPAYMAPELIELGAFDRRTDVYALATVAFELLTGYLPFDDELPTRVMMAKVSSTAPSLSAAAESPFADGVERVIARGLARVPSERYASAGEFVAELASVASEGRRSGDFTQDAAATAATAARSAGTAALDSTRPAESVITRDSRRAASRVGIAAVVAVAAGVLFAWWLVPRAGVAPSGQRQRDATKAPLPAAHSKLETVAHPQPAAPAAQQVELRALPQVVEPPTAPPPATTHPVQRGPRRPRLTTLPSANAEPANDTPQITPPAPTPSETSTSETSDTGESFTLSGNRELLQGHLARAVELFDRAIARDPHDLVALRGLGLANERLGRSADAVRAYRSALALEPNASLAPKLRERLERLGVEP